jgi:hypothetical protein
MPVDLELDQLEARHDALARRQPLEPGRQPRRAAPPQLSIQS